MDPLDILRLTWSSRRLRAILFRKGNAYIWTLSRLRVGWPDCPPGLSEPQYVVLVRLSVCMVSDVIARSS